MTGPRNLLTAPTPATTRDDDWRELAACKDQIDDWLWFDHGERDADEALEQARVICAPCPAKALCLAYATEHKLEGLWAGTSEAQRKNMRFGPLCREGHDLTLPGACSRGGECRLCRNARERRAAAARRESA